MKPLSKHIITSASLFTLLPIAAAIHAQENKAEDDLGIENITVTAQRRAESIQSTPVSMTALSATDVERMQIDNIKDIAQVAPNVNFKPVTGGSAGVTPFIRGGGVTDGANITSEAEVGIYIDDVYQPRSAASFIEMLDIERIEVLRGPQGTLYGRNSSAGALKIISREPDELFRLKNEAGVGTWNEFYDKLLISGSLSDDDKLRGGIAAMYRDRDGGRQYNATLDKDVGAETYKGAQADLVYIDDDISARFKAFFSDYDSDGLWGSSLDPNKMSMPYADIPFTSGSIDTVLSPYDSYTSDKQVGASLNVTKHISDNLQLVSITSWNKLEDNWATGFSGGVYDAVLGIPGGGISELYARESISDQRSFTQELQIQGDAYDDFLNYVAGVYYFNESGSQAFSSSIFFTPSTANFDIHTDSYALFGQASMQFTDKVAVTLGGRYTKDKKSLDAKLGSEPVQSDDEFSKFTPKVGLDYQLNDDILLFASYTEGFKAGGYNGLASSVIALSTAYDMQTVTAYEIGFKSDWLNHTLRINLAGFFNDYAKLQQGVVTNDGTFITENYDAEHQGLEAEMKYRLSSDLSVWANGVYQDSEYTGTSATGGTSSGSLLANRMTNVFDYQYAAGADYTKDIGDGTFAIGSNINRRGDFYSTADNAEIGHVPAQTLVDAYVSYSIDRWKITLAGKNLTNEKSWFTGFGFSVVQPRFMADPMTWRLSVSYQI